MKHRAVKRLKRIYKAQSDDRQTAACLFEPRILVVEFLHPTHVGSISLRYVEQRPSPNQRLRETIFNS